MTTHTLWAGPSDGLEVDVNPGQIEYIVRVAVPSGQTPAIGAKPTSSFMNGLYVWVTERNRFEWKGYQK